MKTWIVNTNSKAKNGNPNGFLFMLRQNKISSYYKKKTSVDIISPGDLILLYHNRNRIIAVGFALKNDLHDFADISDVEHWVDVNWIWKSTFRKIDNSYEPLDPINRKDIKIKSFRKTVENISNQIDFKLLMVRIGERQNLVR